MKKIWQSFNDLKIRNKLLIVYMITVLLPIIISNVVFYQTTSDNFIQQKRRDADLMTEETKENVKQLIDQALGLSTTLYMDMRLYEFFDTTYIDLVDYIQGYTQVVHQYKKTVPLYNAIQDIQFYTTNPTMLYAGGVNQLVGSNRDYPWFSTLDHDGTPQILATIDEEEGVSLDVYRKLNYFSLYANYMHVVHFQLDERMLTDAIHNASIQGEIYLLDEKDNVLFTTDKNHKEGTTFKESKVLKDPYVTRQVFTDQYIEGWSIVSMVDESIYKSELADSTTYIFLLGLMNFILPAFLIIYLSRSFHSRLNNILDHTRHITKENFSEYPHVKSKDEIGQLASQINRMTRKMNQLFNEVFKANLEKKELELREKEAQLSALQSQINPHFLFNALETIRMRSIMKEETETAMMIENMAGIFRNSLKWGSNWVTVLDEVRLIQAFLEIQGYRFGERLTYHVYVDEQLADFEIPNLTFLPFVENASLHGIEPKKGTGNIDVSITKTALGLRFVIEDDGIGIPEARLIRLQQEMEEGTTMGDYVGIENIYYRLKLYYKDQFRMKIESEEGIGTTVTIDLPMQDSKLQAYLKISD